MEKKADKKSAAKTDGFIAGGSALSGLAAVIGASCCVLPILLVNLGASTAFVSNLTFFARYKPQFAAVTIILIAIGFAAAFWRGRRPGLATMIMLSLASFFALGAYLLPQYEPYILRWLNS